MTRRLLTLLALAACEPGARPPETPTPSAPPAPTPPAGPTPRARPHTAVRSCPVAAPTTNKNKPAPIQFDPRINLGDIDGVSWLFGYAAGDAVLAHLAPDSTLATIKVPLHNAQAGAIDGSKIWLYAPKESNDVPTRWTAIDVSDPDRPVTGDVVPLTVGARLDYADALAVGPRRALVITGVPDERELVLLDPATRAAVAPPQTLGKGFEPVHAFCADDRCSVVAIADEGGGPTRRLVVVRVLADGAREQELLAPDWIGQPHAAELADEVIVAWPEREGLKIRALDLWGRPRGPATPVPWDSKKYIRHTNLLASHAGVVLAIGERERWSVTTIGPGAVPGPLREIPASPRYFLVGAPLDDGLAWINLGGDVSYEELGRGVMTHFWQAEAVGGFLPTTGDPTPPLPVGSGSGGGRGGLEPFVLTRPGAAAALLVPRGDADNFSDPSFTPLRTLCP